MSFQRRCRFSIRGLVCKLLTIAAILVIVFAVFTEVQRSSIETESYPRLQSKTTVAELKQRSSFTKRYMTFTRDANERTGNLLFKYAALIAIARQYNFIPVLKSDEDIWQILDCESVRSRGVVRILSIEDWSAVKWTNVQERLACSFSKEVLEDHLTNEQNVRLVGYFQSWKYFRDAEAQVFSQLLFRNEHIAGLHDAIMRLSTTSSIRDMQRRSELFNNLTGNRDQRLAKKHSLSKFQRIGRSSMHFDLRRLLGIDNTDVHFVGVHIRRGDLVYDMSLIQHGYLMPSATYFNKAISALQQSLGCSKENLVFIVSSDEPSYARRTAAFWDAETVFLDSRSAVVDLLTLTACDHTIMSVGSFGWWAAYLKRVRRNDSVTVYYAKPFRANSELQRQFGNSTMDYYPPEWISVDD